MGHGHVTPNPDGSKARCGGPGLCKVCQAERAPRTTKLLDDPRNPGIVVADTFASAMEPVSLARIETDLLAYLEQRHAILSALEDCGVRRWEGFDLAMVRGGYA